MIKYLKLWLANKLFKSSVNSKELEELLREGVIVKEGFLTSKECEILRDEGEKLIQNQEKFRVGDYDSRVFGYEERTSSDTINSILNKINLLSNETIGNITYLKERKYSYMYNNTKFSTSGLGSGGGWHRDSAFTPNFKIITYLTDVSYRNGPFQYIKRSHKLNCYKRLKSKGIQYSTTRLQDEFVNKHFSKEDITEFTGIAGTTIIAITNGIHRGLPVEENNRMALTRYNFYRNIPNHIQKEIIK